MASKKYPLRRKSFPAYRFQLHGSFMLAVDIWYRPYKTGENVAKPVVEGFSAITSVDDIADSIVVDYVRRGLVAQRGELKGNQGGEE